MAFDAAYEALTDHDDDSRWAYGTGFADPLAGVPTAVPSDVDRADLAAYCLMLGDDALVMSHRLQQWVTRAPELEDELAIANIGLDLLGQARLLLTRAGEVEGRGRDEDALAYLRDPADFRNVLLAERADADFAELIGRLLVFATWRLALLDRLSASRDPVLAAIGAKGTKEVTYHREYAAQWVIRLGDGTALSHDRMQAAIDALWPLIDELFRPHEIELRLAGLDAGVDPADLRGEFDDVLARVFEAATVRAPGVPGSAAPPSGAGASDEPGEVAGPASPAAAGLPGPDAGLPTQAAGLPAQAAGIPGPDAGLPAQVAGLPAQATKGTRQATAGNRAGQSGQGGRDGVHTAALTEMLNEMQELARSLPGGVW